MHKLYITGCPYTPERWDASNPSIIADDGGVDVSDTLLTDGPPVEVDEDTTITVYNDDQPTTETLMDVSFEVEGGVKEVMVIIRDDDGNVVYNETWVGNKCAMF